MVDDALSHALFWVILAGLMLVRLLSVLQVRRAGARFTPDRQAIEREGRAAFAVRFLGFFLLIGILAAYAVNPRWMRALDVPLPAAARWIGFLIGLLGAGIAGWAQVTIGRQWSAQLQLVEGHQVIATGPYALIRHPIYAALIAVSIGLAILTANWLFIGFGILSVAMSIARVPREEKMLRDELAGYADYAAKVRYRLLPGIW